MNSFLKTPVTRQGYVVYFYFPINFNLNFTPRSGMMVDIFVQTRPGTPLCFTAIKCVNMIIFTTRPLTTQVTQHTVTGKIQKWEISNFGKGGKSFVSFCKCCWWCGGWWVVCGVYGILCFRRINPNTQEKSLNRDNQGWQLLRTTISLRSVST